MPYKVVITDYIHPSAADEEEILAEVGAELVVGHCSTEDEVIALAHDADGLLNTYFRPIGRRVLEACPHVAVVARYGVGVDTIDVPAATDLGVLVANVPDYCVDEVSDHALALLLACARKVLPLHRSVVEGGQWDYTSAGPIHRLEGQVMGVVGFGRIGRRVAEKARAFGLRTLAYDPFVPFDAIEEAGAEPVPLDELVWRADFVSLHLPLSRQTRHLFDAGRLRQMKPTAYLINTARGGLVDNEGLRRALQEGWIAGAGVDLLDEEVPFDPEDPLFGLPNLVITPHVAFYSEESKRDLKMNAAREVARVLSGQLPVSLVNPDVVPHRRKLRRMTNDR